jgi:hypothetical protein
MGRMNWKRAHDDRRIATHGTESINGARSAAAVSKPESARRKAPQLAEPVIIDRWWKNRAHDAVYVRLTPFKEHVLIDLRTWVTDPTDGITRPGKGFACTAKHLPRLHAAIGKALSQAIALGLIEDDGVGT